MTAITAQLSKLEALAQSNDTAYAMRVLRTALSDDSWGVRRAAVRLIGDISDGGHADLLIPILEDPSPAVRYAAVRALAHLRDCRAVQPLITRLREDDKAPVRASAAMALGDLGDAQAVEALLKSLDDHVLFVVEAARLALMRLGETLLTTPASRHNGRHSTPAAIRALVAAIGNHSVSEQDIALEMLLKLEPAPINMLLTCMRDSCDHVRYGAAKALGNLDDSRINSALRAALADTNYRFRCYVIEALGKQGDGSVVGELARQLVETDQIHTWAENIRDAATQALKQINTPEARAVLDAWYQSQSAKTAGAAT